MKKVIVIIPVVFIACVMVVLLLIIPEENAEYYKKKENEIIYKLRANNQFELSNLEKRVDSLIRSMHISKEKNLKVD